MNDKRPSVRALLIEDNPGDARLVREILAEDKNRRYDLEHAATLADGLEKLAENQWDVIISDLTLPDCQGLDTFNQITVQAPTLPIILLTGVDKESFGLEAVRSGAQDYLVKGKFDHEVLIRAIQYAIERKKLLLMRDEFVNMVSHELRNPLAILRESLVQFGEASQNLFSPDQKEIFEIAVRTVDRLGRTTNELLNLAKMEAGKTEFYKTRFDLIALVDETTNFFYSRFAMKGLQLRKNLPGHEVMIEADRDKIAEVLTNLLTNALKFTLQGFIEVTVHDTAASVVCMIADTGPGISEEDLPKIFSKFEQFGKKSGHKEQGSGLGLAICKEIVEKHLGKIWVESKLHHGSQFIFSIPKK
jgi:signal transduction histidine kinase